MFITSKLSDMVAIFNWCFIFSKKWNNSMLYPPNIYIRNQGKNIGEGGD